MKILYILSGTEIFGGATKSFLVMADAMAQAGHEIAVMVPDEKGITPTLRQRGWIVNRVSYDFCALPRLSWSTRDIVRFIPRLVRIVYLNMRARRKVTKFAKEWHPDIIHDNTSVTDLGHYAAAALGVPHVIHVREYGWRDFRLVLPFINRRLMAHNAYLAAITSDLASFRGKDVAQGHVRTIYNGILKGINETYISKKEPYFLYAGRIVPAKGVDDLIEAYIKYTQVQLSSDKVPLRLVLAGNYFKDGFVDGLVKNIKDAGIENYVDWLGEIDNIYDYYSRTAATVIPSLCEGFGRVMPEAMAAGSLCIARNSGGLAEQLENGRRETGREIALGFNSTNELADILSKISDEFPSQKAFSDGGKYKRMIDDSRKVVSSLYTCEAYGRNLLDYYSYILRDQGIIV